MPRFLPLLLVLGLTGPAAAAPPWLPPPPQRRLPGIGTMALHPEGEPHLVLDFGRDLGGYLSRHGMRGAPRQQRCPNDWLSAIEKARLDARRVWVAPRLSSDEKLERIVAIVQQRLPRDARGRTMEHQAVQAEMSPGAEGFTRLSRRTALRAGGSFERAWLLRGLLDEVGVQATVRTGERLTATGRGPHAWVEALLEGERRLVDPSATQPLPDTRSVTLRLTDAAGNPRRQSGLETLGGWLYLPE